MNDERARGRVAVRAAGAAIAVCAMTLGAVTAGGGVTAQAAVSTAPSVSTVPAGSAAKPASAAKADRDKVAYLTFDDGPHPVYTAQILWLLDKYEAEATFFMVGSAAEKNPAVVREVRRSPHSVGNHTYSHAWLTRLNAGEVRRELRSTDALLGRTRCMRPPGGFVNDRVRKIVGSEGRSLIMWTVDTLDWARPGASAIARTAIDGARPGSIILMHDGGGDRSQTVRALAKVLRTLKADGYRFETLPKCRR